MEPSIIDQEQQLYLTQQGYLNAISQLEELKEVIKNQNLQIDYYKNRYFSACKHIDEQHSQMHLMQVENNRNAEHINVELKKAKDRFKEKLQKLGPLTQVLRDNQQKLEELQQLYVYSQKSNESLTQQLHAYKAQAENMQSELDNIHTEKLLTADEKTILEQAAVEVEDKLNEAVLENEKLKTELVRMEEDTEQNKKRVEEKLHDITHLLLQLETVRSESSKHIEKTKRKFQHTQRHLETENSELRRQVEELKAQVVAIETERDDLKQNMQVEINTLNDSFREMQARIKTLQKVKQEFKN